MSEATARRAIQETKEEQAAEPEAEPKQPAPLTAEGITKKAKANAGCARSKRKRAEALAEELELWRELAETSSTALEAPRSELAAEDIDDDEEMRGDLQADAGRMNSVQPSQPVERCAMLRQERRAGAQRDEIDRRLPGCAAGGTPSQSASEGYCGRRS